MRGTIWCLHGAVGMAEDWRGFSVPDWGVKRVDLWRFLDCCPMGMAEFGRALNGEAAAVAGPKVLLGYSMGGRLALQALLCPGHPWDAAVIVSAHPGLEAHDERVKRLGADAEWAAKALSGDWRSFLREWNAQGVLAASGGGAPALELADRAGLEPRRRPVARSFVDWSLGAQEPTWTKLGGIACPVLWVVGERDDKFRVLGGRAVPAGGFEPWLAPGAGHRVPWESAEFPARVGEFLERVLS